MSEDAEGTQPAAPQPAPEQPQVSPETPDPEIWVVTESVRGDQSPPQHTFRTETRQAED
jgi:hypothetical protein